MLNMIILSIPKLLQNDGFYRNVYLSKNVVWNTKLKLWFEHRNYLVYCVETNFDRNEHVQKFIMEYINNLFKRNNDFY